MTISALLQRWSARFALVISLTVVLVGCSTVPRQYVKMAEPGVTLTELIAHPGNIAGRWCYWGARSLTKKRLRSISGCM